MAKEVIGSTRTLAVVFGLSAFFALYAATRSALMRSASASSSSSSPKRSTSSSSSASFAAGADAAAAPLPERNASPAELEPDRFANSASKDLMCWYQRATFTYGACESALKIATSAWDGA
jgi:hypothetical protein